MKEIIDLAFFTIGENYLHTVKNILTENKKAGNRRVVTTYGPESIKDDENYEEQTKRSDFNIFIPTIFLFYHGLELMFKGLLKLQGKTFKPDHKISLLYDEINNSENQEFTNVTKKYIVESDIIPLIGNFLIKNDKTIDSFYEIFRYPSSKDGECLYNFFELKYKEEKGIEFAEQVIKDIDIIRKLIVTTYRKIKDSK